MSRASERAKESCRAAKSRRRGQLRTTRSLSPLECSQHVTDTRSVGPSTSFALLGLDSRSQLVYQPRRGDASDQVRCAGLSIRCHGELLSHTFLHARSILCIGHRVPWRRSETCRQLRRLGRLSLPDAEVRDALHTLRCTVVTISRRCNVDLLRIIQLGLTLCNAQGELYEGNCTWQFNFRFSLKSVSSP